MNEKKAASKKAIAKKAVAKTATPKAAVKKAVAKAPAKKAVVAPKKAAVATKKVVAKVAAPKAVAKKAVAKAPAKKAVVAPKQAAVAAKKVVAKVAAPKAVAKKAMAKAPAKKAVVAPKQAAVATKKVVAKVAAPKAAAKKPAVKKAVVKAVAEKVVAENVPEKVVVEAAAQPAVEVVAKPVTQKADVAALYPESVVMGARALFTLRAEKVQLLDLRGVSDVADWYLVATCTSEAQMQAILNGLSKDYKAANIPTVGIEYRAGVQWAVLDVGEVMVHLFEENKRKEFALDLLWRDGKIIELKSDDFVSAQAKVALSDDFV
jgi:ribosome-associated protein